MVRKKKVTMRKNLPKSSVCKNYFSIVDVSIKKYNGYVINTLLFYMYPFDVLTNKCFT